MFDEGRVMGVGCPRQANAGYLLYSQRRKPVGRGVERSNFRRAF